MHCCARNIERLTRILKLRTELQSRLWLAHSTLCHFKRVLSRVADNPEVARCLPLFLLGYRLPRDASRRAVLFPYTQGSGVSPALATAGISLIGVAYFVIAMRRVAIFQRSFREAVQHPFPFLSREIEFRYCAKLLSESRSVR